MPKKPKNTKPLPPQLPGQSELEYQRYLFELGEKEINEAFFQEIDNRIDYQRQFAENQTQASGVTDTSGGVSASDGAEEDQDDHDEEQTSENEQTDGHKRQQTPGTIGKRHRHCRCKPN